MGVAATVVAIGLAVHVAPAAAAPSVRVDPAAAKPDDTVVVYLSGFRSSSVNVAICGNLARRGSSDCNMQASQNQGVDNFRPMTYTIVRVTPPPVPCPCVVRVADQSQSELAVAPLEVIGHPVAPVVDSVAGPLVEVSIAAHRRGDGVLGALRAALGGRATYDVTVTARNRTTDTLSNVALRGAARRRIDDDAAALELPSPGRLAPGQVWTHHSTAELRTPVIGRYVWTVTASGAGASVDATSTTDAVPVLLFFVVAGVVIDLVVLTARWTARRRRRMRLRLEPALVSRVAR